LSASTFGIFIFHVTIFDAVIRPIILPITDFPGLVQPFAALIAAFLIVIICAVLDLIRDWIFKLLKIRKGADAIERLLCSILTGIENNTCHS
jgi:hypothetical protein